MPRVTSIGRYRWTPPPCAPACSRSPRVSPRHWFVLKGGPQRDETARSGAAQPVRPPGRRGLHGRNGEGRLFDFALGDQLTWQSVALVDGSLVGVRICGNTDHATIWQVEEAEPTATRRGRPSASKSPSGKPLNRLCGGARGTPCLGHGGMVGRRGAPGHAHYDGAEAATQKALALRFLQPRLADGTHEVLAISGRCRSRPATPVPAAVTPARPGAGGTKPAPPPGSCPRASTARSSAFPAPL